MDTNQPVNRIFNFLSILDTDSTFFTQQVLFSLQI